MWLTIRDADQRVWSWSFRFLPFLWRPLNITNTHTLTLCDYTIQYLLVHKHRSRDHHVYVYFKGDNKHTKKMLNRVKKVHELSRSKWEKQILKNRIISERLWWKFKFKYLNKYSISTRFTIYTNTVYTRKNRLRSRGITMRHNSLKEIDFGESFGKRHSWWNELCFM